MKNASFLIKPASSNCNLRCSYCFYHDLSATREQVSYGIMSEEVMNTMIEKVFQELDDDGTVMFAFQGGEPTVAGLDYFLKFTKKVDECKGNAKVNYAMQTNGTLLNDDWCQFLHNRSFLVGISLDGYEGNTNKFRYDAKKQGVYFKIMQAIRLLRKHHVEFNVLTVLTESLAHHPKALFDFYRTQKFEYVQLIPCLPSLMGDEAMDAEALTPITYGQFFMEFFDLWFKEVQKGRYISINQFDNLITMIKGYAPYQCGVLGHCSLQCVVEGDGSVYPCDFFVSEDQRVGKFSESSLSEMMESKKAQDFVNEVVPMKEICEKCEFKAICHGGCKRMNACFLSDEYCGYQALLKHSIPALEEVAKRMN